MAPLATVAGDRLLGRLTALATAATSAASGAAGVTRLAWSPEDLAARRLLRAWVDGLDVSVTEDAVGNLVADLPGRVDGLAPIAIGSHLDTVIDGGSLDGAYGVVAAFEILAAVAASGERLRHPLRAVSWVNEEGVVAPPFTGSLAASGTLPDLTVLGPDGVALAERLARAGSDPSRAAEVAWGPLAAYLELHIEQGPILDHEGITIGVVTAITGSRRGTITATGRANHAGTTPMALRSDALVAIAPLVAAIEALATRGPLDVATVGSLVVHPGNGNVVPGEAVLSYDLRSTDDAAGAEAMILLRAAVADRAATTGVSMAVSEPLITPAVPTDPKLRQVVIEAADVVGCRWRELPSGAGHDAQNLAGLAPVAMIFVPSAGGVSHSPDEATPPGDLVAGAAVLLETLRRADVLLDP